MKKNKLTNKTKKYNIWRFCTCVYWITTKVNRDENGDKKKVIIIYIQVADSEFESTGVPLQIQDEAAVLGDVGGGHSNDSSQSEVGEPPRLLLVSTKIRNSIYFRHSIKPSVIFVQYKYDSMTTDGILGTKNPSLLDKTYHY